MTREAASKDPLHGMTLEKILNELVVRYGWKQLGILIPLDCFLNKATISSSLRMLRQVPWARAKVEKLYAETVMEDRAKAAKPKPAKPKAVPVKPPVPAPDIQRKSMEVPPGMTAVPIALRAQIKMFPQMDKPAVHAALNDKLEKYFGTLSEAGSTVMVAQISASIVAVDGVEKLETMNFYREDEGARGPHPRDLKMGPLEIPVPGKISFLLR